MIISYVYIYIDTYNMYVAVYGFSQSLIYEYKLATYRENTPDTLKHVANLRVFQTVREYNCP